MIIAFQNNDVVVVQKPAGVPVQPDQTQDASISDQVRAYLKRKPYILHRIDRPVYGLVAFGKHKKGAARWQSLLMDKKIERKYLAIVEGRPEWTSTTLSHTIKRNGRIKKSFIVEDHTKGSKKVSLQAQVLKYADRFTALEITLDTGYFHQIRAQLSHVGHPIRGDVKYGARRGLKDRSIELYAHYLSWETIEIKCDIPRDSIWHVIP